MTTLQIRLSLFMCLVGLSTSCCAAHQKALPTRSECIVEAVRLDAEKPYDREAASSFFPSARKHGIALAAYQFDAQGNLYFQFSDLCAYRLIMAADILRDSAPGIFKVSNGPVVPGPNTIDVRGPAWKEE